jgi:hypothetical protein
MPVPISVTNPNGVGLTGHYAAPLETSGPFARLAFQKSKMDEPSSMPEQAGSPADWTTTGATAAASVNVNEDHSIVVQGLTFSYPGLGEKSYLRIPSPR